MPSACRQSGANHTTYFVNGFVTCPYGDGWKKVIESVEERDHSFLCHVASLTAERIEATLYHPNATPVLVRCQWNKPLPPDNTIPKSLAIPLMLSHELPNWEWSSYGETWETMRHYFLGEPHGKRSSLFVDQETGQAMKNIWNAVINTGMFGSIKVD